MRQLMVGLGYRRELAPWLNTAPKAVHCLEITAEHFFDDKSQRLEALARQYPLLVHGLGLSLGTPGPLEPNTLNQFQLVARRAQALWVSEHVAFTRSAVVDLGHLNPVLPTDKSLATIAEHARDLQTACDRPVLLENIATHWRPKAQYHEPAFLERLIALSGAGLLLDVTNLFVNSRNHHFCPFQWLEKLPKESVRQLHVVGYSEKDGRWHDRHAEPIQEDLWELIGHVLKHFQPAAAIIERDQGPVDPAQLTDELTRLAELSHE